MGNIKRVFVASPGDVKAERLKVKEVIDEINNDLPLDFNCRYEFIGWEDVDSRIGIRPQAVINAQAGIKNVDIFIGILWSRFGTPSGGKDKDGNEYGSGTEEEFKIAFENCKERSAPRIMFFRNTKDIPQKTDPAQFKKVKDFFDLFKPNEKFKGLYLEYDSTDDFEMKVRRAILRDAFRNYGRMKLLKNRQKDNTRFPRTLVKDGFLRIFTVDNNEKRNSSKATSIKKAKKLKLIAHSGYSFLSSDPERFRDIVESKLKDEDFEFHIILTNPWSDTGYYFALGEKGEEFLSNAYEYNKHGIKSFIDTIDVLEKTIWYTDKFKRGMDGYLELREKYGDKIQLRLLRYEMPASILITDIDSYFEPYLPIKHLERYYKSMITFEMKVSKKSSLYGYSEKYFDFLWSISDDYDIYSKNEMMYIKMLKEKERFFKER